MDGRGKESLTRMSDRETLERAERFYKKKDKKFFNLYNGQDVFEDEEMSEYGLMLRLALFCEDGEEQLLRLFKSSGQFRDEKPNAYYIKMAEKGVNYIEEKRREFAMQNEAGGKTKNKAVVNSKR